MEDVFLRIFCSSAEAELASPRIMCFWIFIYAVIAQRNLLHGQGGRMKWEAHGALRAIYCPES